MPEAFAGVAQSDGYGVYERFAEQRGLIQAGFWAHARRGFYQSREESRRLAGIILRQIGKLYAIEAGLREERAGPEERRRQRRARSRPLLNRLYWLLRRVKLSGRILPQSGLGRAIDYALGQWSVLLTYVEQGEVEIDNNACERKIRPTAVSKKNWLFIGHAEAAQRSAVVYTVIESCRAHGIDALGYLRDVLTRLPAATNWQIPTLTPAAWAKPSACSTRGCAPATRRPAAASRTFFPRRWSLCLRTGRSAACGPNRVSFPGNSLSSSNKGRLPTGWWRD